MAGMYADLVKHLKNNGCWKVRAGKGSHEIWYSPIIDLLPAVNDGDS